MSQEPRFDANARPQHLHQAEAGGFDLLVVGGGITGAGVARECALRGLSFCLVDKNDFSFGTSSRSSKLVHGGMRYLSHGDFNLVRESVVERNWLRHDFPNLVRPLGFMYCAYEHGKDQARSVKLGLRLYDLFSDTLSAHKNYRPAKFFSPAFVEELEPEVAQHEATLGAMQMAGFYYDNHVDDARLTVETIKESLALAGGRSVALNHARVERFLRDGNGRVDGARVVDELTGGLLEVRARVVVSCVGAWSDEVMGMTALKGRRIFPTKGVHVVVPAERLGNQHAFGVRSFDDGRFFFVLRRGSVSVLGTTDTDYAREGRSLDDPVCLREDCDYLLRTVNRLFPRAELTYRDIISTYAGIRPLIKPDGDAPASAVSRRHEIYSSPDGVVALTGGKLTTYRRMAEDLLLHLVQSGRLPPFAEPGYRRRGLSRVPFLVGITRDEFERQRHAQLLNDVASADQIANLHQQYGREALTILKRMQDRPSTGTPLLEGDTHCVAEIQHLLENENAAHLVDVMSRRTEMSWMVKHTLQPALAERVAVVMGAHLGWRKRQREAEIQSYLDMVRAQVAFLL